MVGYYDRNKAKDKQKDERQKQVGLIEEWKIPEKYLRVNLDKEAREQLIQEIGYPKKWTTLKKWLDNNGYIVKEIREKNIRYTYIDF